MCYNIKQNAAIEPFFSDKGVWAVILGIGIDLCNSERMAKASERPRFLERVYTPAERARIEAASGIRRSEIAAGLFACKEAVAKALGTGFVGFFADAIEITPDDLGRPVCALAGGALKRAAELAGDGGFRVWVSITHEEGFAAAQAILERENL